MVESRAAGFARPGGRNVVVRYRERGSTEGKSQVAQESAQIRRDFAVFLRAHRIRPYFPAQPICGRVNRLLDPANNYRATASSSGGSQLREIEFSSLCTMLIAPCIRKYSRTIHTRASVTN